MANTIEPVATFPKGSNQCGTSAQPPHGSDGMTAANLPAVVAVGSKQTRIGLVLADAEFDSERNLTYIGQQRRAHSVIPSKRGNKRAK